MKKSGKYGIRFPLITFIPPRHLCISTGKTLDAVNPMDISETPVGPEMCLGSNENVCLRSSDGLRFPFQLDANWKSHSLPLHLDWGNTRRGESDECFRKTSRPRNVPRIQRKCMLPLKWRVAIPVPVGRQLEILLATFAISTTFFVVIPCEFHGNPGYP